VTRRSDRPRSLRIVVDVDPRSAPLAGRLSAPPQSARDFVGLVELLAAVEEFVEGVDQPQPDNEAPDNDAPDPG
jgi:hypothetical protein